MSVLSCYNCGASLGESDFGRRDSCEKCGRDTRSCKNCKHYDTSRNNQCREEQAPRQVEKEKSNFCEWFQPGGSKSTSQGSTKEAQRAAAEALFKKK